MCLECSDIAEIKQCYLVPLVPIKVMATKRNAGSFYNFLSGVNWWKIWLPALKITAVIVNVSPSLQYGFAHLCILCVLPSVWKCEKPSVIYCILSAAECWVFNPWISLSGLLLHGNLLLPYFKEWTNNEKL